ncbi:MAG TPA: GNAT family N-acetyltransferase, partial [Xanthomonadales bacterium]|nr:GNAT family N-acetyltransferase [Xanthomonadales bacterium]
MIDDRYFIEPAVWSVDADALKAVRTAVFIVEQQIPERDEWDADDEAADHVLARSRDGVPIGTGRLLADGRIGRMAVVKEWRGEGVGAAMLRHLMERAAARGMRRLKLSSQKYAVPFYAQAGFVVDGPEYLECDIPHQGMLLDLPVPGAPGPVAASLLPAPPLAQRLSADRAGELRDALLALLGGARHEVCIYSRDLEPPLYEDAQVLEAIRKVALSGRRAQVRILLQDTSRVVREGHRMVDLAQRLSSIVHLRRVSHEDATYPSAYVLTDGGGYLFRTFGDRFEAVGD